MQGNHKIKTLDETIALVRSYRVQNKKIVHCHGVFDLLHIGHIRYFEQARCMGDILIVTITPDRYVDKGPHRPAFNEILRAEAVASLSCVDHVAINQWPTAEETLRLLRPDIYVKGAEFKNTASDMTGKMEREEKIVKEIGATLAFTEDIVFSSTNLINRYLSNLPKEINKYLDLFRHRYLHTDLLEILDELSSLNVLVIGDIILDEYQYCDAIGKSSKDPMLALKYQTHDLFAGGVLAIANHIANFADNVELVTVLGEIDSHESFIRTQLHPNISPYFEVQPKAPTLIKRRFIDSYTMHKLFEVYMMDDSGLPNDKDLKICNWLKRHLHEYDLAVVADFGHGTISPAMVDMLTQHARYLAINTQANAGNRGFHTITKYPRIDYACISEHELRLETRTQNSSVRPLIDRLAKEIKCHQFSVTRGRNGCAVWQDGEIIEVPSFAHNTVDRIGAGDAFFSVTSLASYHGVSSELIGFIGNVVGALAVEILGNKKSIDKPSVQKYITSLLK
ncbi:MAG: adenylyltransferase/cytidyltransferase family protein [Deltaproteobacteria bacterium]|nr:adenylyltransferase/cytidyltransferase family protein [Deltaproteobacteria bacterium]